MPSAILECGNFDTFHSAKRSIQYLLDKWGLQCALVPRESFDFDDFRFTGDNDTIDDEHSNDVPLVRMNAGSLSSVFVLVISSKQCV